MCRALFSLLALLVVSCTYHDTSPKIIDDGDDENPEPEPVTFVCHTDSVGWEGDILPIMIRSCTRSGCHDGISRANFTRHDIVKENAASIKVRVRNRSMPFDGPPLTKAQIDSISCWVDKGALNN